MDIICTTEEKEILIKALKADCNNYVWVMGCKHRRKHEYESEYEQQFIEDETYPDCDSCVLGQYGINVKIKNE